MLFTYISSFNGVPLTRYHDLLHALSQTRVGTQCVITMAKRSIHADTRRTFTVKGSQLWLDKYPISRAQYDSLESKRDEILRSHQKEVSHHGLVLCEGVLVLGTREGSHASHAGILPFDEIFEVAGTKVGSFPELQNAVRALSSDTQGTVLNVKLYRQTPISTEGSENSDVKDSSDLGGKTEMKIFEYKIEGFREGMGLICLWVPLTLITPNNP